MGSITIHLKQHTPMLHFQHEQYGATLRATEVKPKLDKFILQQLKKDHSNKPKWLITDNALNYKIKIFANLKPEEYLFCSQMNCLGLETNNLNVTIIPQSPFFAQEQENGEIIKVTSESRNKPSNEKKRCFNEENWKVIPKKGLLWEDIQIRIFSLDTELINYIKKNIESFFICTNFGTRNGKGYGCFTVLQIDNNAKICLKDKDFENSLLDTFDFVYKKSIKVCNTSTIFKTIKSDYQWIKSGLNFGKTYEKSKLMKYAFHIMTDSPKWDKRFFKQEMTPCLDSQGYSLLTTKYPLPLPRIINAQFLYIRALLGLAEQYEFLLEPNESKKRTVTVKGKSNNIERFQSPLLFKVFENNIYIVGNKLINPDILGKKFKFTYKIETSSLQNKTGAVLENELQTPSTFNLQEFMEYAMTTSNPSLDYTPVIKNNI